MTDFLLELILSDAEAKAEAEAYQVKVRDEVYSLDSIGLDLQWTLSVDGLSNMRGCDAGILLDYGTCTPLDSALEHQIMKQSMKHSLQD